MKKLCLLLAVIITAAFGCSEEKTSTKSSKIVTVKNETKIKTADQLFAAIEEKFKNQKQIFPQTYFGRIIFKDLKQKIISDEPTIWTTLGPKTQESIIYTNVYNQGNLACFLYSGNTKKESWNMVAKYGDVEEETLSENDYPELIVDNKTDDFKKFFKKFELAENLEKINGNSCYKITAVTDNVSKNIKDYVVTFWIDCERFLTLREESLDLASDCDEEVIERLTTSYKLVNDRYEETSIDIKSFSKKDNRLISEMIYKIDKIAYGTPFNKKLIKCPKDENDYKHLQDYFNMLLKKYYDNKYQIEIK